MHVTAEIISGNRHAFTRALCIECREVCRKTARRRVRQGWNASKGNIRDGTGSKSRGLIIPEPNRAGGAESSAHCYADDRRVICENVTGTLIIYATRLLLNATVIMFAGFCDGDESDEGPRQIIASQLSSRCSKGESAEEHSRDAREREREREGGGSRGRKTSTYELNYIRQSWRPITYSARVTRDSNPD